jgi:hypothetical protein
MNPPLSLPKTTVQKAGLLINCLKYKGNGARLGGGRCRYGRITIFIKIAGFRRFYLQAGDFRKTVPLEAGSAIRFRL